MTAQIDLRRKTEISPKPGSTEISPKPGSTENRRKPGITRMPHRVLWLILLLIAMAVAAVVGVVVAANVTNPPAPTPVVYQEPNANEREGRVPTTAAQEPNANEREGRVADNN
jgi:hypothetical protein